MKFDTILEYQKVDQQLMALENSAVKSAERQRLVSVTQKVNAAQEAIKKLTREASDLMNAYAQAKNKLASLGEELDGFDGIVDEVQDTFEADHYIKLLTAIRDEISVLEKTAASCSQRIDMISETYQKTWAQGVQLAAEQKAAKADYDAMMEKMRPQVEEIKTKLQALAADIPEGLMKSYSALRASRKLPAVVPYDVKNNICGGCRMELASDTRSKLKNPGDYAECPDCRRILYVPEG